MTQKLILTVGYIPVDAIREMIQFTTKMHHHNQHILSRMYNSKLDLITETGLRLPLHKKKQQSKNKKATKSQRNQRKNKKHIKTRPNKKR